VRRLEDKGVEDEVGGSGFTNRNKQPSSFSSSNNKTSQGASENHSSAQVNPEVGRCLRLVLLGLLEKAICSFSEI
jgi:hypothetical protein